jgi:hypothetical protein
LRNYNSKDTYHKINLFEISIVQIFGNLTSSQIEEIILSLLHSYKNKIDVILKIFEKILFENNTFNYNFSEFFKKIIEEFEVYINEEYKFELFSKGLFNKISENEIIANVNKLDKALLEKTFSFFSYEKISMLKILKEKILVSNSSESFFVYDLGKLYLSEESFNLFEEFTIANINQEIYYDLWVKKKAKTFPSYYINFLLNKNPNNYNNIAIWIKEELITQDFVLNFMLENLYYDENDIDSAIFNNNFYRIKYIIEKDSSKIDFLFEKNNSLNSLIIWSLCKINSFNFQALKKFFVYFPYDVQNNIVKKLFYLKSTNLFDLNVKHLKELSRFDLNLFKKTKEFLPEVNIDLTSELIINIIVSFSERKKFLCQSELIAIILNNPNNKSSLIFDKYFESCKGQMILNYVPAHNGFLRKVNYEDKFYFSIEIPQSQNFKGREYKNRNYDALIKLVLQLPEVKWNPQKEHFGIKSKFETDVYSFARKNKLKIYTGKSFGIENIHLYEMKRHIKPFGINYCEGRKSKKPSIYTNDFFYWCKGYKCHENCESIHEPDEWENYTLLDFCKILNLNLNETNKVGDNIENGKYYQFVSLINKFNHLLTKLICNCCSSILYPIETSHFARERIVKFKCNNIECKSRDVEIYLNNCLNGHCSEIIDSRISKKCPNGLFICKRCSSCCSNSMVERRYNNLNSLGGHIHFDMLEFLKEKKGHKEKGEIFCYRCGDLFIRNEDSNSILVCKTCNSKFDSQEGKYELEITKFPNSIEDDLPF